MKTSETIDLICLALADAQGLFEVAQKNKINPHFKSHYADITAVWDACRPSLAKHHLAVLQETCMTPDRQVRITTRIVHKSGQWIEAEPLDLKPQADTPQAVGSAITYGKRYALSAMLGVVADEDDDGNAASQKPPQEPKKPHSPQGQPKPPQPTISQDEFTKIIDYCKQIELDVNALMQSFKQKTARELSQAFISELPMIKNLIIQLQGKHHE